MNYCDTLLRQCCDIHYDNASKMGDDPGNLKNVRG